jgi:phospholipase A-2-activating protein
VSATLPKGGFAAGSSDKSIRVYTREGTLVKTLDGHESGVLSLSMTAAGDLVSGSWDGTARVWDLASYKCTQTLAGMENAITVLGLPNGDIVCGSTGRKTPEDRHVDFKIRVWRGGAVVKTMTQHEQAVRDFAPLPSGGFASASNDG